MDSDILVMMKDKGDMVARGDISNFYLPEHAFLSNFYPYKNRAGDNIRVEFGLYIRG